jgi:hypothetical protein
VQIAITQVISRRQSTLIGLRPYCRDCRSACADSAKNTAMPECCFGGLKKQWDFPNWLKITGQHPPLGSLLTFGPGGGSLGPTHHQMQFRSDNAAQRAENA